MSLDFLNNCHKEVKESLPISIEVLEPPCKNCLNWSPRVKTNTKGDYNGVVLCIGMAMCSDFSCYQERRKE